VSARKRTRGLLDTSVFIAAESGRRLDLEGIPDDLAISIVTSAELRLGVLAAEDVATRNRRLATLESVGRMEVLPIWAGVQREWAAMRAYLVASGGKVNANDVWIAATAAAYGMPVVTQDRDFNALSGVGGLTVVEV
jgi:predicted nucleic acid-binding protein